MKRKWMSTPCKCWFLWFMVAGSGSGGAEGGANHPLFPGQVLPWKCWGGASARYYAASLLPTGKYREVTAATNRTVELFNCQDFKTTFSQWLVHPLLSLFPRCHKLRGKPDIKRASQKRVWITAWPVGRHLSVIHLYPQGGCLWSFIKKHS